MQADVDKLMSGELGAWLKDQASMRSQAIASAIKRALWGGAGWIVTMIVLAFATRWFGDLLIFIGFASLAALGWWVYKPIVDARRTIKVGINSAIAADLGIRYSHDVDPGREWHLAKMFALVPSYDRDEYEDLWFGDLDGHPFQLYEAHLQEQRGSGENRRYVTVFRGAIITMGFGRPFYSTTLLQRKGKHKKWFGFGGRADEVDFGGHVLSYVDQVHPKFEDVFEMYSDDQVEARLIVHPSYIEHLIALEKAFNGRAVRALFSQGEVLIAVESGNLFESGALNAGMDRRHAEQAARHFSSLARLALALNQTERGAALGGLE